MNDPPVVGGGAASRTAFLLSPESGFITGALIPVDGGYTAK